MYIRDFVKIIDYFINHTPKYKSYNIGTGKRIDLLTLAKKINAIAKVKQPIVIAKSGFGNEYTCDTTRLYKEVPKDILTPINETLQELYGWYADRRASLDEV
jgi:GDP-L-fucose synthase